MPALSHFRVVVLSLCCAISIMAQLITTTTSKIYLLRDLLYSSDGITVVRLLRDNPLVFFFLLFYATLLCCPSSLSALCCSVSPIHDRFGAASLVVVTTHPL